MGSCRRASRPARLRIVYNPTEFIQQSVDEVDKTLFEAVILVVLVIMVFLQSWRAALIPIVAIPVSLIGTFAVMAAFGFSLNNLTLFGLVLAIGIVVDDAIVVVENIERNLRAGHVARARRRTRPWTRSAARWSPSRWCCARCSCRPPSSPASPGQFYRQFALTIAAATIISLIVSLTLSPALAALLLKPHGQSAARPLAACAPAGRSLLRPASTRRFDWLSRGYGGLTAPAGAHVGADAGRSMPG